MPALQLESAQRRTVTLGLLLVNEVKALGLDHAINERASEASHELLSLGMAIGLAVLRDVVLVGLGGLVKRGQSGRGMAGDRRRTS